MLQVGITALFFLLPSPTLHAGASGSPQAGQFMGQGNSFVKHGDLQQAIVAYTEAEQLYGKEGGREERLVALHRLSGAYRSLGQYSNSLGALEKALFIAREIGDQGAAASILADVGLVCLYLGSRDRAGTAFKEGLALARLEKDSTLLASVLGTQARLYAAEKRHKEAISGFREALSFAKEGGSHALIAGISVHAASVHLDEEADCNGAQEMLTSAARAYRAMEDSHEKAYGLIFVGRTYVRLGTLCPEPDRAHAVSAHGLFCEAETTAGNMGDKRALSYANGYLGQLYEDGERYEEALQSTRKAIFAAQEIDAPESLYLWEWQLGRLFSALGEIDAAVKAYKSAIQSYRIIRQGADTACDSCGPLAVPISEEQIFFQLADLLLSHAASLDLREQRRPYLIEARETIEMLKTVEIQDYFQDPCVAQYKSGTTLLEDVSENAMVVYSITFPERLDLLVNIGSRMERFTVPVSVEELIREVRTFRLALEKRTAWTYLAHARKIYDWIIRPLERELVSNQVSTLIIVPDGHLRTIPLAALHDGRQFLIQKFATVTTPGLNLTDPQPLERKTNDILMAGLAKGVQGFPPLSNVKTELEGIQGLYGGKRLENEDLVVHNLDQTLRERPYSIVHIATHGEFAHNVSESYLLTWNDRIDMDQLDQLMRLSQFRQDRVELLTLSACQTAAGDDRAALGLAGIAIKAGARSALATLWNVSDQAASELIVEFYRQLHDPKVSKAKALQRAQGKLLGTSRYRHPFYWAPFLLIGNWL